MNAGDMSIYSRRKAERNSGTQPSLFMHEHACPKCGHEAECCRDRGMCYNKSAIYCDACAKVGAFAPVDTGH